MPALAGKADMRWPFRMSPFDPKRTCRPFRLMSAGARTEQLLVTVRVRQSSGPTAATGLGPSVLNCCEQGSIIERLEQIGIGPCGFALFVHFGFAVCGNHGRR